MTLGADVPAPSPHSLANRLARSLWAVTWLVLFRPSPKALHGWRWWLLRLFGARIGRGAVVHPSCPVRAPWNLRMGNYSCLAFDVDCCAVDEIHLGDHAVVSQYSHLCTATHDYEDPRMPFVTAAVGEGAVVRAVSAVFDDIPPWTVVGGNPARALITPRQPPA